MFLSRDNLELNVLPYGAAGDAVSQTLSSGVSSNGNEVVPVSLPISLYPVAKTGSSIKFGMEVEVQLKVKRPNATALISGITIV